MNYASCFGSVYVITNLVNGAQYVGQTIQSVERRFSAHKSSAQRPRFKVSFAIAEFGKDSFRVDEVFVSFDKSALDAAEKSFISILSPEYNMTVGGAGSVARTAETKSAYAAAQKRAWSNPGRKQRAATTSVQNWLDPVVRQRRIEGLKKANANPEMFEKRSNALKGLKRNSLVRSKMARAKWKPVYCPELQCSFLSQRMAAVHFGVVPAAITQAIKQKGKVSRMFTLEKVA
jgi:group I intron endonuclease